MAKNIVARAFSDPVRNWQDMLIVAFGVAFVLYLLNEMSKKKSGFHYCQADHCGASCHSKCQEEHRQRNLAEGSNPYDDSALQSCLSSCSA